MHEWKSNCVSNQFGGIFSAIMSRCYSEERVRVHRYFKQNQLGKLKKQQASRQAAPVPHMFPNYMAHVMHVMYSTLYWSISVPPLSCLSATWHLGSHDLCMFHKRFIHLEACPKSLSKLKCHKGIVWICKLFAPFLLRNLHWVPKLSYKHVKFSLPIFYQNRWHWFKRQIFCCEKDQWKRCFVNRNQASATMTCHCCTGLVPVHNIFFIDPFHNKRSVF